MFYQIKASYLKLCFTFIALLALQVGCFAYIAYSDFITYSFIFAIIGFFLFLGLNCYFIFMNIKFGRPNIRFEEQQFFIETYRLSLVADYRQIPSLSLSKFENSYKGITTIRYYELTIYSKKHISVHHKSVNNSKREYNYSLDSRYAFSNKQILEITVIFSVFCRTEYKKRRELLQKINSPNFNYETLISSKELKNFKENHYLTKNFNNSDYLNNKKTFK